MSLLAMPRKKVDRAEGKSADDRSGRKTAPVQVDKELARMVSVIAAHRKQNISDIVSPLIKHWVRANYELVQKEMAKEVQQMNEEGG